MRPVDGLPDPRGQLSLTLPSSSIVEANRYVQKVTKEAAKQKRGPYKTYSPTVHSEIGKYACQHGVVSAARVFSQRLEKTVSETTVRSIRNAYREELRKKRSRAGNDEVSILPSKKHGRRVLLGQELDKKVQLYLKKVREGGGAVSSRIAMAAAHRILMKCNRGMLSEFGGPVQLNNDWARSLLKRMQFVQRRPPQQKANTLLLISHR